MKILRFYQQNVHYIYAKEPKIECSHICSIPLSLTTTFWQQRTISHEALETCSK